MNRLVATSLLLCVSAPLSAATTIAFVELSGDKIAVTHSCGTPSASDTMSYEHEFDVGELESADLSALNKALSNGTAEVAITVAGINNGTKSTTGTFSGRAVIEMPSSTSGPVLTKQLPKIRFDDYGTFTKQVGAKGGSGPVGSGSTVKLKPNDVVKVHTTGSGEVVCLPNSDESSPNRHLGARIDAVTFTF